MEALLAATTLHGGNKALEDALFSHAESVSQRFFGREVFYRGIVEFSNVRRAAVCLRGCAAGWVVVGGLQLRGMAEWAEHRDAGRRRRGGTSGLVRPRACACARLPTAPPAGGTPARPQVCENDCNYCGIRKHQPRTHRYTMPREEVLEMAEWALRHRMGTLMLQVRGSGAGRGLLGRACGRGLASW